jgi:site-specific DNA recombinase
MDNRRRAKNTQMGIRLALKEGRYACGAAPIPELGEEEEQSVLGIHEPIVNEDLFYKVQQVLAKILEKNASRVEKSSFRKELPLRGMLQCSKCQSTWTGSGSKGNGGVYYYYHCQNGCKERVKAEEANSSFIDFLKTFKVYPEVANLYLAIIEDIFKSKEGDREKEIEHSQKGIKELEARLFKIDELYINGKLEDDSYRRMKMATKEELQKLTIKEAQLKAVDTSFMKYSRYGLSLLTHLDEYYQIASPTIQQKLLGSIFTEKLIFEDGKYRTPGLNEAVALIGQFKQEFGHKKAERLDISDKTFGNVPIPRQL